jgi:hypothetical protein
LFGIGYLVAGVLALAVAIAGIAVAHARRRAAHSSPGGAG